jgi:hypothetical protein
VDDRLGGAVGATVLRYGPDRRLTVGSGVLAIGLAVGAWASSDPAGRLLLIGAAAILATYVVTDLVFFPRITASSSGVVLNSPFARAELQWEEIERLEADSRQRLGLRSTTLEVDTGELVAIFSRRALGAQPEQVAAELRALRGHR